MYNIIVNEKCYGLSLLGRDGVGKMVGWGHIIRVCRISYVIHLRHHIVHRNVRRGSGSRWSEKVDHWSERRAGYGKSCWRRRISLFEERGVLDRYIYRYRRKMIGYHPLCPRGCAPPCLLRTRSNCCPPPPGYGLHSRETLTVETDVPVSRYY